MTQALQNLLWLTDSNGTPIDFGSPYGPGTLVPEVMPPTDDDWEKAVGVGISDYLDTPFAEIMDPARTPAKWLPFLAAHFSVDLWFDDWPEARKRQMVAQSAALSAIVGTVSAAAAYLAYVDTEIIHKVSHPARYPVGRIAAGITPINHKPFVARYLLRTELVAPSRAVLVAKTCVGRAAVRTINREPLRRAKLALTTSKAPETAYSVTFAHRLPITLDDTIDLDSGYRLGDFKNRKRL